MRWIVRGSEIAGGELEVPGDKSIGHRALMIGAIAKGESTIRGLPSGADVGSTRACLERLGVTFREADGTVTVFGGRLQAANGDLDAGNSGTTMRLMAGILAGQTFDSTITGDESLCRRPMGRVAQPLIEMGGEIASDGGHPPLRIQGRELRGIQFVPSTPSAQVKSAVLLAGIHATGPTTVIESVRTRDHTERMLQLAGVHVKIGENGCTVVGPAQLQPFSITIPGDFSSAAFWLTLGAISGSRITVRGVSLNPTRTAFLNICRRMGANITVSSGAADAPEPYGDITVSGGTLSGTTVTAEEAPLLIDELPLVAALGTAARGETSVSGAAELRVKESDRIAAVVSELRRLNAEILEREDGFVVSGGKLRGSAVSAHGDHRIAMMLAVTAAMAEGETIIEGAECAKISYPGFAASLQTLGVSVVEE